ncbi:hypothetical protein AS149_12290 [Burkholderia cenocepacia]|nr:hypothetical protein AS149_12290 [Burkholderia cenocepacia]
MRNLILAMGAALAFSSTVAFGAEAHVCTGPTQASDAPATKVLSNTLVFDCGNGLKGTIPDFGRKGFRIAAFSLQSETAQTTVTQLIIQHD